MCFARLRPFGRFAPISLLALLAGCEISSGTPRETDLKSDAPGVGGTTEDLSSGGRPSSGGTWGSGGMAGSGGMLASETQSGGSGGNSTGEVGDILPSCQPGDTGPGIFDGDLEITTANVAAAAAALADVWCVTGQLSIKKVNFPLSNLSQLEQAQTLSFNAVPYFNLRGLESLKRVHQFSIIETPQLNDISAIDGIDVTGRIVLDNVALDSNDLAAFNQVTRLEGGSQIDEGLQLSELQLTDLSGFENLEYSRSVDLSYNPELSSVAGATALTSVDKLTLAGNDKLHSFDELPRPTEVLQLISTVMTDCGPRLTASRELLVRINGEQVTSLSCLEGATELSGLVLGQAPLENLNQLQSLKWLTGLSITSMPALTSLAGLDSLDSVLGVVTIAGNNALETLEGLKPSTIGNDTILTLLDNDTLPQCLVDEFASQVTPYACACDDGNDETAICP